MQVSTSVHNVFKEVKLMISLTFFYDLQGEDVYILTDWSTYHSWEDGRSNYAWDLASLNSNMMTYRFRPILTPDTIFAPTISVQQAKQESSKKQSLWIRPLRVQKAILGGQEFLKILANRAYNAELAVLQYSQFCICWLNWLSCPGVGVYNPICQYF